MKQTLTLLFAGMIATSTVYAQNSTLVVADKPNAVAMHTTRIYNSGMNTIFVTSELRLGNMRYGRCYYTVSEMGPSYTLNPNYANYVMAYGDVIAQKYGNGYNCAEVVVKSDHQLTNDDFAIYSNGSIYYSSSPFNTELSMDF